MNPIPSGMDPKCLFLTAAIGFILMLAGFVGYVVDPGVAYQAAFVVGVVLLVAGYTVTYLITRRTVAECQAEDGEEDENGFFYILDEDYSAPTSDATIEDLTKRM